MSRCLRICGAYTYRLTRRHSTILLITSFILTLTVIFQLYAYKHQDIPHFASRVGDFEYKPGSFLRGQQPNANVSYCQFNYGLPNKLKWKEVQVLPSPEVGNQSGYRVIYDAVQGTYANYSKYNAVTYATQATPEFIYHIVEIARYWDGPISLAVFVPGYDLDTTMQIMNQLCQCYSDMSKVSLHLFFPKRHLPKVRDLNSYVITTELSTTTMNISIKELLKQKIERYKNLTNETRAQYVHWVRKRKIEKMMAKLPKIETTAPSLIFPDCSGLEVFEFPTYRLENNMIYPINVGRNVARNASRTNYFIVSDIELVPSEGLATKFLSMMRKLMGNKKRDAGIIFSKTVFVVPLFEVEKGVELPRDKNT